MLLPMYSLIFVPNVEVRMAFINSFFFLSCASSDSVPDDGDP